MVSDTLDTCVILSFILGGPKSQCEKTRALLEKDYVHNIPDLAISETIYVLENHYDLPRKEVCFLIKNFLGNYDEVLNYNHALLDLALPFYETHPQLSFNDCCMAFYAELNHAEPLFTFDRQLAKKHPSAKILD